MNRTLLVFLFFLIANLSFSQLSYGPVPAELGGYTTQAIIELPLQIKNEGDEDLLLLWRLKTINKPPEWGFQVCDLNLCYDVNIADCAESKPNLIAAGVSAPFIFYTLPNNVEGVGEFVLELFPKGEPQNVLVEVPITATVLFTSTKDLNIENLKIFPNPTSGFFQLSNYGSKVTKLSICNIVGKEMKSFKVQEGSIYDVSYLPPGMYLVRLYDDNKSVVKVVRLSKR